MFNPEWLCANQGWLSVVMVILSIVGMVAGLALFFATLYGASKVTDKAKDKLEEKYGWRKVYEFKEKASDRFGLLVAACGIVFAVSLLIFEPRAFLHIVLTLVSVLAVMVVPVWGATKVGTKLSYEARQRWKKAFGAFMICLMLCGVCIMLYGLYEWWILKICGGL